MISLPLLLILLLTAAVFLGIGLVAARQQLGLEDYLTGGRRGGPGLAFATVTATTAGAWILLSPPEAATWAGVAGLAGYAVGQAAPLVAFSVIGPRMRRLMPHGHNLTEYARVRFGDGMLRFTVGMILFYMFVALTAELTGVALAFQLVADLPPLLTAVVVAGAVVAYTSWGGLRASVWTDAFQCVVILPLLLVLFAVTWLRLGGMEGAFAPVADTRPELLRFDHGPGVKFGITLVLAILSANLFNQGFWQRVYLCRDDRTVRRGFLGAAVVIVPVIALAGLFGIFALGTGLEAGESSVALFRVVLEVLPPWAVALVLVLGLALVMSSMDSLLTGMASVLTTQQHARRPELGTGQLLRFSRWWTAALAVPAVLIASQGYSVLYLFLLADLVAAGMVVPLFAGLYSRHLRGRDAIAASAAGMAVGALFFPLPSFDPWLPYVPFAGDFLASFAAALLVSTTLTVARARQRGRSRAYDFDRLEREVEVLPGRG